MFEGIRNLLEDLRDLVRAKTEDVRLKRNLTEQFVQIAMRLFFDVIQRPMVAPPSQAIGYAQGQILKEAPGQDKVELKLVFDSAAPAPDPDEEPELEDLPDPEVDEIQQLRGKANGLKEELLRAISICQSPTCECRKRRESLQAELTATWQRIDQLEAWRDRAAAPPAIAEACQTNEERQLEKLRAMKTQAQAKLATGGPWHRGCLNPGCTMCSVIRTTLRDALEKIDLAIARLEISGGGPAIAG